MAAETKEEIKNTALSDEQLAEKLRIENSDQYYILVRMHLSFILDLTTDEYDNLTDKSKIKKWSIVPFGKKSKCRSTMDGAPLTQEGICQVYQLIEFLKKEQNITVEGIFRRTGSLSRQQDLRNLLNQGVTLDLSSGQYSVHDCASVLKGFLADLPEPLLTEAHYPAYCQIAELCGVIEKPLQESRLLNSLQLILMVLPSKNRVLLKDLLDLLHFTTTFESSNKMSADSLATLFTPHLLCPRKLAPETLHVNSQTLSGIISFMITNCDKIFHVPTKLAVDIRAYFAEKERRKLSPKRYFDESVSDNFAAITVFSFVDHERTAKENESNPTETALAQLYAHIQSMPESSKKRKLVKQFNKENGHGTPLQLLRSNMPKNKSFGDSIKKHIFHKNLVKKKAGFSQQRSSSEELLNSPRPGLSKTRLFCTNCNSSSDVSNDENLTKQTNNNLKENKMPDVCIRNELNRSLSAPDLSTDNPDLIQNSYLTSTPAGVPICSCPNVIFTPEDRGRKSMSPITRSTQRMCKAMQETMMTPRSRKPVLLISGTNIANIPQLEKQSFSMANLEEETSGIADNESSSIFKNGEHQTEDIKTNENINTETSETNDSLTDTFREYLCSRSILTTDSPADLSFSSRTDDYNSSEFQDIGEDKLSESLLHCLDGNVPSDFDESCDSGKKLILKPKQFDENGHPIIYETSF